MLPELATHIKEAMLLLAGNTAITFYPMWKFWREICQYISSIELVQYIHP